MQSFFGLFGRPDTGGVQFWVQPERTGWLWKQGEHIKTWRRRFFVMKEGRMFWFKDDVITPQSVPRGVIDLATCVSIKGAEDTINKPASFEIATASDSMFFIADDDKQKEDWINTVGKAIVKHSHALMTRDIQDYDTGGGNSNTMSQSWPQTLHS